MIDKTSISIALTDSFRKNQINNIIEKSTLKVIPVSAKCTITLKAIRESIEPTIREISESEWEYRNLMEYIPRFYRDFYTKKIEHLRIVGFTGNIYENTGDESRVTIPKKAREEGGDMALLLSMHNHPSGLSIQSIADFRCIGLFNQKYSVVVARDGMTIIKAHTPNDINYERHGKVLKYFASRGLSHIYKEVKETNEYKALVEKYKQGEISHDELLEGTRKLNSNVIREQRDTIIEDTLEINNYKGYTVTYDYIPINRN